MTKKLTPDVPIRTPSDPDASLYGSRWGAGPGATPHNGPGSIASDPTSAPSSRKPLRYAGEDAALREEREQGWDTEGARPPGPR